MKALWAAITGGWQLLVAGLAIGAVVGAWPVYRYYSLELTLAKTTYESNINKANAKAEQAKNDADEKVRQASIDNAAAVRAAEQLGQDQLKAKDDSYAKQIADIRSRTVTVRVPIYIPGPIDHTRPGNADTIAGQPAGQQTAELAPEVSEYLLGLLNEGDAAIIERNTAVSIAKSYQLACTGKSQ